MTCPDGADVYTSVKGADVGPPPVVARIEARVRGRETPSPGQTPRAGGHVRGDVNARRWIPIPCARRC